MTDPAPDQHVTGLVCEDCRGVRLHVCRTTHRAGKVVRVLECSTCARRFRSEERIVSSHPRRKTRSRPDAA